MLNNAINIDNRLFSDNKFSDVILSNEEENAYITIQSVDLSEAKKLYKELAICQKINLLRYMFSRRIFDSELLSEASKETLKTSYEDSYGSLCATKDKRLETITLESQLVTRILYISEALSSREFHLIDRTLMNVSDEYFVIMQVINSRLNYRKNEGNISW